MNRRALLTCLALLLSAIGGCQIAEWIGEQRAIEQERRDAWSAATSGSYNGTFAQDGDD